MNNLPENLKENDFYLARNGSYKWYNLIVRVIGQSPFMTLEAWNISQHISGKIMDYDITEWGPKICSSDSLTPLTKPQKPL